MVVRLVIVSVLFLILLVGMRYWPRRRGANAHGVPIGLTLVTSSTCTECVRARDALRTAGATFVVVDGQDSSAIGIKTMSVPVAVVGDLNGSVVMVRRGPAIAADARRLADAASALQAI